MPHPRVVPILKKIPIDRNGPPVHVDLTFDTPLLCCYTLDVREKGSNRSVPGFPLTGDNTNAQDDSYDLPGPPGSSVGRSLWASVSILNQTGAPDRYTAELIVRQGSQVKGTLSTGVRDLPGNLQIELLVATVTDSGV